MSQKIDDILEVLAEIRSSYHQDDSEFVRRIRVRVIKKIAKQRGVDYQTIADVYIRRLAPDIELTPAFDRLVEAWLVSGSTKLQQILKNHALDRTDVPRIQAFFARAA